MLGSRLTESLKFWQHLGLARLLSGAYTGVDAGSPDNQGVINVPSTSINSNAFYFTLYYDTLAIFKTYGNVIALASSDCAASVWNKAMTSKEAHSVDVKLDDGRQVSARNFPRRCSQNGT
jgi:hypothetical protein